MSAKRLYPRVPLLMLVLVIGCQQTGIGQDEPVMPANDETAAPELDEQLQLARDALYKGSAEEMRINAATVLLLTEGPVARKILLEALSQHANGTAQAAVCKALSQAGAAQKPVTGKRDFIEPLLAILTAEDFSRAKLAAEAILLFDYGQISTGLERIARDASLPIRARLNAIFALRLQPDMKAAIELINLVGDQEQEVAAAAKETLKSLGIPVGKDAKARKQIIDGLMSEGPEVFLRDRLIRQEAQVREMLYRLNLWQGLYLSALDEIYNAKADEADKGRFLVRRLGEPKKIIKLWALGKVREWRDSTSPKLPAELNPVLIGLIKHGDRDIRLKIAELLSRMPELNSAEKLLEQHRTEPYGDVKTEIFTALGEAVSYAFSPGSPFKVAAQVREETLELASNYLSDQEAQKAKKGAEVVRKLLEQDGLTATEVDNYLDRLKDRYKQEQGKVDGTLRGELVKAMAGLCAQSVYKAQAKRLYEPLFEEALGDGSDPVREAAVDGLSYIDKTKALRLLRDFVNDPNPVVRRKLTILAGDVGGEGDLDWLAKRIDSTAEGDLAWQAMLKIFRRPSCEATVLDAWVNKFSSADIERELSEDRMVSLLKIAETKAESEDKRKMLERMREKIAELYHKSGRFKEAAEYYGVLYQTTDLPDKKEGVLANLLNVYLKWPNVEAAAKLMANYLLTKDLDPNSAVALTIDHYFAQQGAGTDPSTVLAAFAKINITEDRPVWGRQMRRWTDGLGGSEKPNKPEGTDN
ncbi:MAG: HEAT repeat domain-containing protein [Planctomycetota bacterium]